MGLFIERVLVAMSLILSPGITWTQNKSILKIKLISKAVLATQNIKHEMEIKKFKKRIKQLEQEIEILRNPSR